MKFIRKCTLLLFSAFVAGVGAVIIHEELQERRGRANHVGKRKRPQIVRLNSEAQHAALERAGHDRPDVRSGRIAYYLRHGDTAFPSERLSEVGEQQAKEAARQLGAEITASEVVVLSAQDVPSQQTAEIIAGAFVTGWAALPSLNSHQQPSRADVAKEVEGKSDVAVIVITHQQPMEHLTRSQRLFEECQLVTAII